MSSELLEENKRKDAIIARLSEQLAALDREKRAADLEIERLRNEKERLELRLRMALHTAFGRKSERFQGNAPGQIDLFEAGLLEEAVAETDRVAPKLRADNDAPDSEEDVERRPRKKSRRNGRCPLPETLPRERRVHELSPEELSCGRCGKRRVKIGEKVSEELEYVPSHWKVVEDVRETYKCVECDGEFVTAALPSRPIEKGRPGPGLLAHVVVSKYSDHLPLERQSGIYARSGVHLAPSTLSDWVREVSDLLRLVAWEVARGILENRAVQADETEVRVLTGAKTGKAQKAYLFAYALPWGEVAFDFRMRRARDGPVRFFSCFEAIPEYLQTDGYEGYGEVVRTRGMGRLACMAHVRRKFRAALAEVPKEAGAILMAIQNLYRIERELKERGAAAAERTAVRQERSRPLLGELKAYIDALAEIARPATLLGKALRYARGQWPALERYIDVGEAEIDNNSVEHAIRSVAVGRKNWIFCGSPEGGKRAATLYTLTLSAKRLGLDPWAYLKDVIERVSTHPMSRIRELTPRGWKEARARAENSSLSSAL